MGFESMYKKAPKGVKMALKGVTIKGCVLENKR